MSFIGMDGAEHKIRQLTSQLQSKDAELASVRNELIKKSEALAEEVKAKQALQYQMEQDSRGTETSSKNANSLKNEVALLRQNLTNRETALNAANESIKKLEKEKQGLEYELECAGSNSDQSSRRILEQKNKLESEVKSLRQELQRRESEDVSIKAANAKVAADSSMQPPSGIPRYKRPATSNSNFFGATPTPSPGPSKIPQLSSSAAANRRRSTSLSNTRETELQGKITTLVTQLAGTRTKLDKAENQIMAAERMANKRVEEMERKLEDANDELEFYRHQVGGGGGGGGGGMKAKGELEELRKNRDALKGTVEGLMEDLKGAREEVERLRHEVNKVEMLEKDLECERQRNSSTGPQETPAADEIIALQAKITSLETSLTLARTQIQSQPAESTEEDDLQILTDLRKEMRKLKKELSLTQRMVEEAEKERDEFEAEVESIRAEQAKGKGKKGMVEEREVVALKAVLADAEKRVEELETGIAELQASSSAEKQGLEEQLNDTSQRLETAEQSLCVAQSDLQAKEAELANAVAELDRHRQAVDSMKHKDEQHEAQRAEKTTALSEAQAQLEAANVSVQSLQEGLLSAQQALEVSTAKLSELAQVESQLQEAQQEAEDLRMTISGLEAGKAELEALEFGARQERDQARIDRDERMNQMTIMEQQLAEAEEQRRTLSRRLEEEEAVTEAMRCELEDSKKRLSSRLLEIEELSDKLQVAAADIVKLEQRNAEFEETLANRSTETEAQHRQEEVFQLQEDLRISRDQYELKTMELAEKVLAIGVSATRIEELEVALNQTRTDAEDLRARSLSKSNLALVGLLEAKIERLRSERDELRQTMSFAKHEHRFALEAAEADRLSVKAELEKAKVDLDMRNNELSTVKSELSTHRDQLDTLTSELDDLRRQMVEVSAGKNHVLDDQIRQLQAELDGIQADRDEMRESSIALFNRHSELEQQMARYDVLKADFAGLRAQYADVQAKWVEADKNRTLALAERDECLEKLDSLRPVESSSLSSAARPLSAGTQAAGELPLIDLRTRKHSRRSSLQAFQDHDALEQGKKMELLESRLKEEREKVQAEKDRVGRREVTIESLKRQVERAELAAQVARDDLADEIEDLTAKHDNATREQGERITQLQLQVEQSVSEVTSARAELADAQAALTDSRGHVSTITAELQAMTHDQAALQSSFDHECAEKSSLTEQLVTFGSALGLSKSSESGAIASLVVAKEQVAALTDKVTTLELELVSVVATSTSATDSIATLTASLSAASEELSSTQTSLADSKTRIVELEIELETAQTRLSTLQSERDSLRQAAGSESESTRQEMEKMFTEQHESKIQIKGMEEKVKALEGEMEVLMQDMGASDEAHAEVLRVKEAEMGRLKEEMQVAEKRQQETRAELENVESRVQAIQQEKVALEQGLEAERSDLQEQISKLQAEVGLAQSEKAGLEEGIIAAKEIESKAEAEAAALRAKIEQVTNDLTASRSEAERTIIELEGVRAGILRLEQQATELTADNDRLTHERNDEVLQRQVRVSELEIQLKRLSEVQNDLVTRLAESNMKLSESDTVRADVQTKLDNATRMAAIETEKAAALRVELESVQTKLVENGEAVSAQREECLRLTARLDDTLQQLSKVQVELESANVKVESKQAELDAATERQEALTRQLAEPPSSSVKSEDVQAMEQKLHDLEHATQIKDADVERATNTADEAIMTRNKALQKVSKLERKVAKLEKDLDAQMTKMKKAEEKEAADKEAAEAETRKNTARNVELMKPTEKDVVRAMAPPAVPTPKTSTQSIRPTPVTSTTAPPAPASGPSPAPTPSSRQPLRSMNVFDKSQMPTSFSSSALSKPGNKRMRDPEVEEKIPTEAIMLPPPTAMPPPLGSGRKPLGSVKTGFTPVRAHENGLNLGGGGVNVFAESTPRRNPFAVDH